MLQLWKFNRLLDAFEMLTPVDRECYIVDLSAAPAVEVQEDERGKGEYSH